MNMLPLFNFNDVFLLDKNKHTNISFNFIDLFAGIGGIRLGIEEIGGKCVFSSEFDKHAQKTYFDNYGEMPSGDITLIDEKTIPPFDMLCAGFPCQPFSIAGKMEGFHDTRGRGNLFFDILRIIKYHKPSILFLENVKNLKTHDNGNTYKFIKEALEKEGYCVFAKVLNAKDFGLPQNRERIFIVCFLNRIPFCFPESTGQIVKVGDILDSQVDDKYTISDKLWLGHQRRKLEHKQKGNGFGYSMFDANSPYTSTISARYYKDGSEILIAQRDKNPRKITPKEASRLQGFPETFIINPSDNQAYKQFGNSVPINVVRAVAREILKVIPQVLAFQKTN
jgi:DNA (cytosine-5)-methyltransferase 1